MRKYVIFGTGYFAFVGLGSVSGKVASEDVYQRADNKNEFIKRRNLKEGLFTHS